MSDTSPTSVPENSPRLSGWKDIARHLGRGARTVQRWEKDHGLPVRRLAGKGGRAESVFAFASELDDWLQSAAATRARDTDDRNGAAGNGLFEDADLDTQLPESVDTPPVVVAGADVPGPRRWPRIVTLVLAAVAIVAATLWYIHAPRVDAPLGRVAAPVSTRIDGQALVAVDAAGGELWRYQFPLALHQPAAARIEEGTAQQVVTLVDLDGDNSVEVLVNARPAMLGASDAAPGLYCLNTNGTLRWVYRVARDVSYGGERYGGPFLPYRFFVTAAPESPERRAVWAVSTHAQMFPTLLQRIGPLSGEPSGEYWSNGYVDSLRLSRIGGRRVIIVGACNNESKGASLAVLDASSFSGSAPATKPKYRCDDCPAGTPIEFLVFPKPARFAPVDTSSSVMRIEMGSADIVVGIQHARAALPGALAMAFYRLTTNLEPVSADSGDGYLSVAHALARAGLTAPVDSDAVDPEREFFPLRLWNGTAFVPLPRSHQR